MIFIRREEPKPTQSVLFCLIGYEPSFLTFFQLSTVCLIAISATFLEELMLVVIF